MTRAQVRAHAKRRRPGPSWLAGSRRGPESQSSRRLIEKKLSNKWKENGLLITENSSKKATVKLVKLLTQVQPGSVSYDAKTTMIVIVELNNGVTVFTKTFRSRAYQEAAFSANAKKLTTQLNTQLSQLLNEIVQDSELNAKLLQL